MKNSANNIKQTINATVKALFIGQFFLILFTICSFTVLAPEETEEYNLKAAFIYRFTNYIQWHSHITGNEFIIGIVGSSPINDALAEIASTKTVNDKKIIIRQFNKPEEIDACHILFISRESSISLEDILVKIRGKGTLTISEKEGYAAKGTGINFILKNDKLRFEANPKAISNEGLTASSQLLKLAIIIE